MLRHVFTLAIYICCATLCSAERESAFSFDYDANDQISVAATTSAKRAGSDQARADIAAGRFYIIQYGEPVDPRIAATAPRDEATGYRIRPILNCMPTTAFEAQVKTYNDTMRRWQRKHHAQ